MSTHLTRPSGSSRGNDESTIRDNTVTTTRKADRTVSLTSITSCTTRSTAASSTTTRKSTSSTTRSTTSSSTTTRKSTTTTKATTRKTTPTKKLNKPVTKTSMICTVDCDMVLNLPADGLCDFVLYDSLYKCHAELETLWLLGNLADFVSLAKSSSETQYGCSIDAIHVRNFTDTLNSQRSRDWIVKELFSKKVYHWGVMNAHKVYLDAYQTLLRHALEALKEAAAFSKRILEKRRFASYTFLGCYGGCEMIAKAIKAVFKPDAIVILGHVSFGPIAVSKYIPDFRCIMLPPNLYRIPDDVRSIAPYAHTFYEGCKLAECLRWIYDIYVPLGVSLTLKGRLFEPKSDDTGATSWAMGNYDVFKECDSEFRDHDQAPAVVCNFTTTDLFKNMVHDENFEILKTFDRAFLGGSKRLTLAFDNRWTYRRKMCDAKYNLTHVQFSVAAYDINFDSAEGTCLRNMLFGFFNRTLMLKRFSFLLSDKYSTLKHEDCIAHN
ncbi:uncharacterized protein LOC144100362 [Amblyomma americanum]